MAKKKLKMEIIENDWTRRSTYKKRKSSILKKTYELATLCCVDACVVIYEGPHDTTPETWPTSEKIAEVLSRFSSLPEPDQTKNMATSNSFLSMQVAKQQNQLQKIEREIQYLETLILLVDVLSGRCRIADVSSIQRIANLSAMVEIRGKQVDKRIMELLATVPAPGQTSADVADLQYVVQSMPRLVGPTELQVSSVGLSSDVALQIGWQNVRVSGQTSAEMEDMQAVVQPMKLVVGPTSQVFDVGSSSQMAPHNSWYNVRASGQTSADVAALQDVVRPLPPVVGPTSRVRSMGSSSKMVPQTDWYNLGDDIPVLSEEFENVDGFFDWCGGNVDDILGSL